MGIFVFCINFSPTGSNYGDKQMISHFIIKCDIINNHFLLHKTTSFLNCKFSNICAAPRVSRMRVFSNR